MDTVELSYLKSILQNYPPDIFVRRSDILSIDQKRISMDLTSKLADSTRRYLSALSDLVLHKDQYNRNTYSSIMAWLSKIIETLDALEDVIRLCENLSNIFESETSWARALSIQSMIDIIDVAKHEINTLKDQARATRHYSRLRDSVIIIIFKRFTHVLEILFTMIAIEAGEINSNAITSVIGRSIANAGVLCGATE